MGEFYPTVDAHEVRVWAFAAVNDEYQLVSGPGDGIFVLWDGRTMHNADEAAVER